MIQQKKKQQNVSVQHLSLFWTLVFLNQIVTNKNKHGSRFLNHYNKINVDGIASQDCTREYLV